MCILDLVVVEKEGQKFALETPHVLYYKMAQNHFIKWIELRDPMKDVYANKYEHDVIERNG